MPPDVEELICAVDATGAVTSPIEKLAAHTPPGVLHLAFSVVLYRGDGSLVLQQRASSKYHFPLVWANACCSHPRPGESPTLAAARRVEEELGIAVELVPAGSFTYRASCRSSGLVEHEFDHVFVGCTDDELHPDPSEIAAVRDAPITEVLGGTFDGELAPWVLQAVRLAERRRRADVQSLT